MNRPVKFNCGICHQPTSATVDSLLGMLALCQPCFDARFAKGRAAQEAGK